MLNEHLALFNELAEACGNRYLATKYLASQSRVLGRQSQGLVLESKLITWALTGVQPYDDEELERRRCYDVDVAELEDYLCYVNDKEIADQVRKQYILSLRNKHVVLDDSQTLDVYRQMRVNVILRMIWYGIPEYEGGCMAKIKLEELKYVGVPDKVFETAEELKSVETADIAEDNNEILETEEEYEFEDTEELNDDSAIGVDSTEKTEPEESEAGLIGRDVDLESMPSAVYAPEVPEITLPPSQKEPELKTGIFKVRKLRIYSAPSIKIPAKSFTGNVEVIGEVDNFTIVRYVRPGFGSVVGYTLDPIQV